MQLRSAAKKIKRVYKLGHLTARRRRNRNDKRKNRAIENDKPGEREKIERKNGRNVEVNGEKRRKGAVSYSYHVLLRFPFWFICIQEIQTNHQPSLFYCS